MRENRLCELVDGTLVEKAMGFEESRLAAELIHLVKSYLDRNDLGICVGADGMMRIAPGLVRIPDVSFVAWTRLPGRQARKCRSLTCARLGGRGAQRGEHPTRDGSQGA